MVAKFIFININAKNGKLNVYDNNFTLIIDIYFYETFSTPNFQ